MDTSASGSLMGGESIAGAAVAVVIVNYRTPELTMRCVAALRSERELLPRLRAIVVDGGSADRSAEELANALAAPEYEKWVTFLPLSINGGFGWANNQAILGLSREVSPPEFIHLVNPDAEIEGGAVARLVEELQTNERCGAAGSQLLTEAGIPAGSAFRFPSAAREFIGAAQSAKLARLLGIAPTVVWAGREVDWVTGASVMFRSAALRETGLFDDGFFLYFEEVELMHRLRARGWTVCHVPTSRVVHLEGAATGVDPAAARPMPAYWYSSRRRYFALTGGTSILAANLALTAGSVVGALKAILCGRRPVSSVRLKDIWRSSEDLPRSVPAWGDAPGDPPTWLAHP